MQTSLVFTYLMHGSNIKPWTQHKNFATETNTLCVLAYNRTTFDITFACQSLLSPYARFRVIMLLFKWGYCTS